MLNGYFRIKKTFCIFNCKKTDENSKEILKIKNNDWRLRILSGENAIKLKN